MTHQTATHALAGRKAAERWLARCSVVAMKRGGHVHWDKGGPGKPDRWGMGLEPGAYRLERIGD